VDYWFIIYRSNNIEHVSHIKVKSDYDVGLNLLNFVWSISKAVHQV
jgi:hypothetical protein